MFIILENIKQTTIAVGQNDIGPIILMGGNKVHMKENRPIRSQSLSQMWTKVPYERSVAKILLYQQKLSWIYTPEGYKQSFKCGFLIILLMYKTKSYVNILCNTYIEKLINMTKTALLVKDELRTVQRHLQINIYDLKIC